jgi:hypothetical protein
MIALRHLRFFGRAALGTALLVCAAGSSARAGALTDCDGKDLPDGQIVSEEDVLVCTITINSPDEKDTFHKRVCGEKNGGKHYKFLELTQAGGGDDSTWFGDACAQAAKQKASRGRGCEVLLVSGHFAGKYFFGSSTKKLTTEQLEAASCRKSCEGVLKDPTEVFLFGCNTLSGKTSKSDNAELMGRRLRDDGLSEADVEEIVQGRFGDLGDSNKETMRRVFAGVPNVYGYNDVGPLGATVKTAFDSYMVQAEKDGKTYRDWLTERQLKPVSNIALTQALKAFPVETTCGVIADGDSPESVSRKVRCALGDNGNSIASRLGLLGTVISSEADFMRYVPAMQKFFDEHSPPYAIPADQAAFEALQAKVDPVSAQIVKRIEDDKMKAYPLLRYDLASLAYALGWGPRMKLKTQAESEIATTAEVLRKGPISAAVANLVCLKMAGYERNSLVDPKPHFGWSDLGIKASDVDPAAFSSEAGIKMLGCLQPKDPKNRGDREVLGKMAKAFAKVDPATADAAVYLSFGIDMRFGTADAAKLAFKRLLSIAPQPVLDSDTLVTLAQTLKSAQKHARDAGFEVLRMISPPPTDPSALKAICSIPDAAKSLPYCARK